MVRSRAESSHALDTSLPPFPSEHGDAGHPAGPRDTPRASWTSLFIAMHDAGMAFTSMWLAPQSSARRSAPARPWRCTSRRAGWGRTSSGARACSRSGSSLSLQFFYPDGLLATWTWRRSTAPFSPGVAAVARPRATHQRAHAFTSWTASSCKEELISGTLDERWGGWSARGARVPRWSRCLTHRLGVLQDVHWSGGWFGYFPTYPTRQCHPLQIWDKACEVILDLDARVERGEFGELHEWLRANALCTRAQVHADLDTAGSGSSAGRSTLSSNCATCGRSSARRSPRRSGEGCT